MRKLPIFFVSYVLSIVILNLAFSYVPMIDLGFGMFSPMAVLAGLVFVLRDYAQRETGHFVLFGMAMGAVFSFLLADPYVAVASVAAFALSEIGDWLIYTVTKKPFYKRVIISSVISTPLDTAVFLYLIDGMTAGTFALMVTAKMFAALIIWLVYNNKPESQVDFA